MLKSQVHSAFGRGRPLCAEFAKVTAMSLRQFHASTIALSEGEVLKEAGARHGSEEGSRVCGRKNRWWKTVGQMAGSRTSLPTFLGITEAVQQGRMSSPEGKTSSAEQYLIAQM